ncbi:Cyclic nucleotide-gated ion channel 18 [Bienertia sinuspersici]
MNKILSTRGLRRLSHPIATASSSLDDQKLHYQLLWRYQILDPNSDFVTRWNYIFLLTCVLALFIDPLYFFLPSVGSDHACLSSDTSLLASVTVFRTLADLFYVLHIAIKFRTAFISKRSRVFGRGELVMDPYEIAWKYLKSDFVIDFAASLPLPQVLGSIWYTAAISRQYSCWRSQCDEEKKRFPACLPKYLDCSTIIDVDRQYWLNNTNLVINCDQEMMKHLSNLGCLLKHSPVELVLQILFPNIFIVYDAICERLVATLSTQGTYIFREDDPVDEMLFIIRGQLESSTTGGGRSGFFNSITLRPGDFCGEELLTWALLPNSNLSLPSSTRTVKALSEVEAFALGAEDLRFFSTQFKRLHSKALQDAFRYNSHQWRMWGACYIQSAWRRFTKRKMEKDLVVQETMHNNHTTTSTHDQDNSHNAQNLGATVMASRFAANTRRGVNNKINFSTNHDLKMPKMFKPDMPDFFKDP